MEVALERKRDWTYACSYYGTRDGDASRISEWWLTAMLYSYYCFTILSVGALMTIVGAWWIPARNTAAAVVAGGMVFHVVMIIWLAIVRFSEGGQSCASRPGLGAIRDTGLFLMRAVIGMLALGWIHFLLLWIGNMPAK